MASRKNFTDSVLKKAVVTRPNEYISLIPLWDNLVRDLRARNSASRSVFGDLFRRYCEPHRQYHGPAHILSGLEDLDKFGQSKEATRMKVGLLPVRTAFWFHDVVYTPSDRLNEEKSTEYSERALEILGIGSGFRGFVHDLILMTKHPSRPKTMEEKALVDVDLAVLGKSPEEYRKYVEGIRKEFGFLSDSDFNNGRARFLTRLLRGPIYHTEHFRNLYLDNARANIESELKGIN